MVGVMTERRLADWLQLKTLLRHFHPAVWRRVRLVDSPSITDLQHVIRVLMGWEDGHLHCIHGRDYGCASGFALQSGSFVDFTAGWQIEVRSNGGGATQSNRSG
jgi:hypothetical protein